MLSYFLRVKFDPYRTSRDDAESKRLGLDWWGRFRCVEVLAVNFSIDADVSNYLINMVSRPFETAKTQVRRTYGPNLPEGATSMPKRKRARTQLD